MDDKELKKMMARAHKDAVARKKRWRDLFPMKVKKITTPKDLKCIRPPMFGAKTGCLVAVRPCDPKFGDKTYLGLMIGDVALGTNTSYDEKKNELKFDVSFHNPAILVPELGEIIYGCGSWWHQIKTADDLKMITDADINDVWYVKAMKAMAVTK